MFLKKTPLNSELQENIQHIKKKLGESTDVVIREIRIGKEGTFKVGIFYIDGLSDTASLQNFVIETLMIDISISQIENEESPNLNLMKALKDFAMTVGEIKDVANFEDLFTSLLSGDVILLVDGYSDGLIIGNKHWVERGVTEPHVSKRCKRTSGRIF